MSLQDEVKSYNGGAKQPEEMYYDQCNAYAQKYMNTGQTVIEGYKITKRDFQNNVISSKLFNYRSYALEQYSKMSD